MKWFGNLKTATKIISAFLVVSLILAILGVYSITTLRSTNEHMKEMYNSNLISVKELSGAQMNYQRMRVNIRDLNFEKNATEQTRIVDNINTIKGNIESQIEGYRPLATTPEETELLSKFDTQYSNYMRIFEQGIELAKSDDDQGFIVFLKDTLKPPGDEALATMGEMVDLNVKLAEQNNSKSGGVHKCILSYRCFGHWFDYF